MTQTLNIGLIGLGEVAQLMHLPLLADDPRFRIAAISDVSSALMARVAERYGVPTRHASAEALIADPALDAVFILTPDHLHAPLLEAAIGANKHVFIEKPACLTAGQLRPLVDRAAESSRIVFVGYMRRYAPAFLALKERMPSPDDIRHVRIRDLIRESRFFVDQTRNIFRPSDVPQSVVDAGRQETAKLVESVVGSDQPADVKRAYQVLTGLASHSLSAMRELLGPPKGVIAARQCRGENVTILFDYKDFTAVYEAVIHDVARFDAAIEVLTYDKHYKINYDTPYVRNLPTRLEITSSTDTSTGTEIVGPFYEDAFRVELGAFHHCVTTGEPPKTGLADSLADLELITTIAGHFRTGAV